MSLSLPPLCNKLTFEECELAILRNAVDDADMQVKQKIANTTEVQEMMYILETFLRNKKLVCYGGIAINNILPKKARFYKEGIDVPDYDFFSKTAREDAKELADIYASHDYTDVEAKSGVHYGTFKVFVNYIPIADLTNLNEQIYDNLYKNAIIKQGIYYTPPNYLRMSMYLELSRPIGDNSRWEKILKRLILLNKYYPLKPSVKCSNTAIQRPMETNRENEKSIYNIIRNALVNEGVVFFGGYANTLYSQYMPKYQRNVINSIPDFDVLSTNTDKTVESVTKELEKHGITDINVIIVEAIGDIIPRHCKIRVGIETLVYIYDTIACYSYNTVTIKGNTIKVASIDTMLSFYLAFVYTDRSQKDIDRITCMATFLFDVEQHNRLKQNGLLKRFSTTCYGNQPTLQSMRIGKANKLKEFYDKGDNSSVEYQNWFLKYSPTKKTTKLTKHTVKPRPKYKPKHTMKRVKRMFRVVNGNFLL